MKKNENKSPVKLIFHIIQGALIGLGAVLPGISGGVLSVIFGIYKPVMELLANPFRNFKTHCAKTDSLYYRNGSGISGSCQTPGICAGKI